MSTPQHGVQAGIIQYLIYPSAWMIVCAIILGMIPDLQRLFQKNKDDWSEYNKLHKVTITSSLIPYWDLHIWEDYFMHDKFTGKWKPWVIYTESFCWCIEILFIYLRLS